jgi:hypothetical protein
VLSTKMHTGSERTSYPKIQCIHIQISCVRSHCHKEKPDFKNIFKQIKIVSSNDCVFSRKPTQTGPVLNNFGGGKVYLLSLNTGLFTCHLCDSSKCTNSSLFGYTFIL